MARKKRKISSPMPNDRSQRARKNSTPYNVFKETPSQIKFNDRVKRRKNIVKKATNPKYPFKRETQTRAYFLWGVRNRKRCFYYYGLTSTTLKKRSHGSWRNAPYGNRILRPLLFSNETVTNSSNIVMRTLHRALSTSFEII